MSNSIADEIRAIVEGDEETLAHYGMPRRSGRYPWGSGKDPNQHGSGDFYSRVEALKEKGWKETPENIMKEFGMTTTQYRKEKSYCVDERKRLMYARAKSLADDGLGATEIGRRMADMNGGIPIRESTIRGMLKEDSDRKRNAAVKTADFIREQVDKKGMVDVGADVYRELGVSETKFNAAVNMLKEEGYVLYRGRVPQATNQGKLTTVAALCKPGTEHKEIFDWGNVHSLKDYASHDNGQTFHKFEYPKSLDSKRVKILLADEPGPDGVVGAQRDGIVQIRRGVEDLSLGNDRYAQVRILVDGNKYIKGMAVYSDNMPDGVDVIFNTSKSSYEKALKPIKDDPDNPFGALIKANGQSHYIDKDGKEQLSCINKTRGEGDWSEWKDTLPSQFLGKQSLSMAKKQLELSRADKLAEYDEICSLTNPTIKKHMLEEFANNCDAAAVDLKAAALPGQKYHVIVPVNTLKDNEVYAPQYENGTKLALIRYPHGGTFEIPILTVNNKHAPAKDMIGEKSIDAVCINKKNADRLSGADFDGDTVMCIPTHDAKGRVKITSTPPLEGLKDFDPHTEYAERPGMRYMKDPVTGKDNTQREMGIISNLITDMTLGGATQDELARAVRHSMVVIDAGKHKLDYKRSEQENGIAALKRAYQRHPDGKTGGAATILSRSKGEATVLKRQGSPLINQKGKPWYDPDKPEGSLVYKVADDLEYQVRTTNKRTGEVKITTKQRTQKSTQMAETDDAMSLVSADRHPMELLYADHANRLKTLANQARMEMVTTKDIPYSASAKATYSQEVKDLEAKLAYAELNRPREREAQRRAYAEVKTKKEANPNMSKSEIKKANQQAISKARQDVGAVSRRDRNILITDREWEAIQAGAISPNKLRNILKNTDADALRARATPRATTNLSTAKINKIKSMSNSNYSLAEIARACGCSPATVSKYLKGVN